jgi:hypothetical protein
MVQHLPTNISIDGELLYVFLFLFYFLTLYCSFGRGNFVVTNLLYTKKMEGPWDLLRYIALLLFFIENTYLAKRIAAFDEPSVGLHSMPFEIRYGLLIKNISTEHPLTVSQQITNNK